MRFSLPEPISYAVSLICSRVFLLLFMYFQNFLLLLDLVTSFCSSLNFTRVSSLTLFLSYTLCSLHVSNSISKNSSVYCSKSQCSMVAFSPSLHYVTLSSPVLLSGELLAEHCHTEDLVLNIPVSSLPLCRVDPEVLSLDILVSCSQPVTPVLISNMRTDTGKRDNLLLKFKKTEERIYRTRTEEINQSLCEKRNVFVRIRAE